MFKRNSFLYRNKKSKQNVFSSLIVAAMVVLSAFVLFGIMHNEPVGAATADYLYYKVVMIEADNIDATLTNLPILFNDTDIQYANAMKTDGSDIAFYDSTNTTRYNHEIEFWDDTTGEIRAWVNVTSVSHTTDTQVNVFYGDSDTGDGVGHNPTSVWDTNYTLVYHFNYSTTSSCYDSTANANHGLYYGDLPTNATNSITSGQYFDGIGDYVNFSSPAFAAQNGTIEWFIKSFNNGSNHNMFYISDTSSDYRFNVEIRFADNKIYINLKWTDAQDWSDYIVRNPSSDPTYYSLNYISGYQGWYRNDTIMATGTKAPIDFGAMTRNIGTNANIALSFRGDYHEFRMSNNNRSKAWLDASSDTIRGVASFLTIGSQVSNQDTSVYDIKDITTDVVTWGGTADFTVWSNASGTYSETMEYNLSVNDSQNVTDIRVYVSDLNNTGLTAWLNASNISLYISSDNSSFGLLGTFTDGGSNLTMNTTNWNAGTMAADPFTDGGGITDRDISIYLRFKFVIPAGTTVTDYYSSLTDAYKIRAGHLV